MKKLVVCVALVLGFGLSAQEAEAQWGGGRRCALRYQNSGSWFRGLNAPRRGYSTYRYSSFRSYNYGSWGGGGYGYYSPPVVYSAPVVYVQPRPVEIVQVRIWTEAELISVVKQRFEMKYRDKLAGVSNVSIQRVAGSEEYHKSGALEEVKYLVVWDFTEKDRKGVEKTTTEDKKFELEFDKSGQLED